MPKAATLPKVTLRPQDSDYRAPDEFPLDHVSVSAMVEFTSNPILFKIRRLNRDSIDTATNVSAVVGKAVHRAMELYYSEDIPDDEGEAIKAALAAGMEYMDEYPEGFINYSSTVETKQKAVERVSFAVTEYIKQADRKSEKTIGCEEKMIQTIDIDWRGERLRLPCPLKGFIDRVARDDKGRLKLYDYKTCSAFSNLEKIDGSKILQAVEYYLLAYATYGEEPHSMTFEEIKTTKNKDGGPQVRKYEIIYSENHLYFDFFFRLFADIVRALNGQMVYVPNVKALYDNEVAIIAYIQRLDVTEEAAKLMAKHKVETLTELLKSDIQMAGNMRKLLQEAQKGMTEAKSINYETMTNQEKIQTKLLEHGMIIRFDSVVEGATVDLYRFSPSIGIKMSRIRQYADDIQQVLGASGIRVLAPIPGTTLIGFEVPRTERRFPAMPSPDGLNLAIGETVDGKVRRLDLRSAPHMLVSGSTGSGKSVCLHAIIEQLIGQPDVEMHLFDPKMIEFKKYAGSAASYLTDPEDITAALAYLVDDMNGRYTHLMESGKRDSESSGLKTKVIVIDEFADLAAQQAGLKERATALHYIQLLAQKGRAAGIHLIIATQRASTKVITGDVKVNFPVKAVFRMAKEVDSRVMLDEPGAEKLLGKGDMIFCSDAGTERLQGYLPAGL